MKRTTAETLLEQGEARGFDRILEEAYEKAYAKAYAKAYEKAFAAGRAEGRAKGKAEALLRLARIKFGDVPSARVSEIQAADETNLDRWIDALVDAGTLEEVFDPCRHR